MLLPRNYVDAVQSAGGIAIMLPPDPETGVRRSVPGYPVIPKE